MKNKFAFIIILMAMSLAPIQIWSQVSERNKSVPTVINVEIDWMDNGVHSHQPSTAEIDAVVQMFACQGIELNVDISNNVGHVGVMVRDPADSTNFFNYSGSNGFDSIKALNQNHTGGGWHYCLFGHQYQTPGYKTSNSSGLGEMSGDDFVVTLGSFTGDIGTSWDRAATFAHELGHNLGLPHSGGQDDDIVGNYKVNLISIMSYRFQLRGVKNMLECLGLARAYTHPFKNLDYSHGRACALDESNLNETLGMKLVSVDWNCDGSIDATGVNRDLSNDKDNDYGWCGQTSNLTPIYDYPEWDNISDNTASATKIIAREIACVTSEEDRETARLFSCTQPTLETESCVNKELYYVSYASTDSPYVGNCSYPYPSISRAQSSTSSGDYLILQPGNYPEATLVLNKRRTYAGPGRIIIGK